jgi:hypothetical protein
LSVLGRDDNRRSPSGRVTPPSGEHNGEEGKEGGEEESQEALSRLTGAVLTNCPTLYLQRGTPAPAGGSARRQNPARRGVFLRDNPT